MAPGSPKEHGAGTPGRSHGQKQRLSSSVRLCRVRAPRPATGPIPRVGQRAVPVLCRRGIANLLADGGRQARARVLAGASNPADAAPARECRNHSEDYSFYNGKCLSVNRIEQPTEHGR